MDMLIVSLPLILAASARVIEASALVILALRRDRPLRLGGESNRRGRLRLRILPRESRRPSRPKPATRSLRS